MSERLSSPEQITKQRFVQFVEDHLSEEGERGNRASVWTVDQPDQLLPVSAIGFEEYEYEEDLRHVIEFKTPEAFAYLWKEQDGRWFEIEAGASGEELQIKGIEADPIGALEVGTLLDRLADLEAAGALVLDHFHQPVSR